jgi:hypothetical protein
MKSVIARASSVNPTPQSLDEAIEIGIPTGLHAAISVRENAYFVVRDFMAQKFTISLCRLEMAGASKEVIAEVQLLFKWLTDRYEDKD